MKAKNYDDKKFIEFIKNKWVNIKCAMCEAGNWCAYDRIMQLTNYENTDDVQDETLFPVIPIYCDNCGYTVLVNALIAGVIDTPE